MENNRKVLHFDRRKTKEFLSRNDPILLMANRSTVLFPKKHFCYLHNEETKNMQENIFVLADFWYQAKKD